MAKQTFYNLPETKQEKILEAAMQEFASAGYDLSSIQKIIESSGISRGSFYQYFDDKTDLFVEVMVEISRRKMKYLQPVLHRKEDMGFFDLMKELVKAGVEFGMNDPLSFQVAKGLASSKSLDMTAFLEKFKQEILERIKVTEEMLYTSAIRNSLDRGEIDHRYSLELIVSYTGKVMEGMSELYWNFMANQEDLHSGDYILNEMIHFLRYGLSSTNKPGQEAGES